MLKQKKKKKVKEALLRQFIRYYEQVAAILSTFFFCLKIDIPFWLNSAHKLGLDAKTFVKSV